MSTEIALKPSTAAKEALGIDLSLARRAHLPAGHGPALLVVIDTEEEFDWSAPFARDNISVSAIQSLPPVQRMFEQVGVRPTYVIDYPVASTKSSAAVIRSFAEAGTAEVGAHLHPWVNPPFTDEDEREVSKADSYGGNLSADLERGKLKALAEAIEANVGVRARTYKAGRYGVAPRTIATLRDLGFTCDTSSSPWFDWSGDGGPNFRDYPNFPYWIGGFPPMLEVPTTGGWCGPLRKVGERYLRVVENTNGRRLRTVRGLLRRTGLAVRPMLTPEGYTLAELKRLARQLVDDGLDVLSLSFHSPSVGPGHTAFVRTPQEQAEFIERVRQFCVWFRDEMGGKFMTASELYGKVQQP